MADSLAAAGTWFGNNLPPGGDKAANAAARGVSPVRSAPGLSAEGRGDRERRSRVMRRLRGLQVVVRSARRTAAGAQA